MIRKICTESSIYCTNIDSTSIHCSCSVNILTGQCSCAMFYVHPLDLSRPPLYVLFVFILSYVNERVKKQKTKNKKQKLNLLSWGPLKKHFVNI